MLCYKMFHGKGKIQSWENSLLKLIIYKSVFMIKYSLSLMIY